MHNRNWKILCALIAVVLSVNCAYATEVEVCADSEFAYAFASLSTTKGVSFSCTTYEIKTCIKITNCWLQQKIDGEWSDVSSLSTPSTQSSNTNTYGSYMDYSNEIGSGTFRVAFTVNADGHAITRYSNERTY